MTTPKYAEITLTIEVNQEVWDGIKRLGSTDLDVQHQLEQSLRYGISRTQVGLMRDIDDLKVKRFFN